MSRNLMKGRLRAGMLAALVGAASLSIPSRSLAAADSRGTDFWLAFTQNYDTSGALTLFIAGSTATSGTVAAPGIGFSTTFTVAPGVVTSVAIPMSAMLSANGTAQNLGIHVTAAEEVTVYGLNRRSASTDAFLGLPNDILGTEYLVLGYPTTIDGIPTELGIVAIADATTVTITPSVAAAGHAAGVPYTVLLNQGQTYELQNGTLGADLSGTLVASDKAVAVYGGNKCTDIPVNTFACDYVVEQIPPLETWGKKFVTMPLATRTAGDTFRFLASVDATQVSVNGAVVATLGRGQVYESMISGPAVIEANEPILVAQYSNSSSVDGVTSDPFMMLIPPYEQFLGDYTVSTPASGFATNFINVVAPAAAVGQVVLDGANIPAASFTAIGASGFSGAQLPVALGSHHLSATLPFGAFVYGFDSYDSYGYPGGMSLAPVARVTKVELTPPSGTAQVGTQYCVTAKVLDQNNAALPGVRVDFLASGANTASGFAIADAGGTAQFCYAGSNAGDDSIVASVGTITSNAVAVTWTALAQDKTPPTCKVPTNYLYNGDGVRVGVTATVQDTGSGLASVATVSVTNVKSVTADFAVGTTEPVTVTFLKDDLTKGSRFTIRITDVQGNHLDCDPAMSGDVAEGSAGTSPSTGCSQGAGGLLGLIGLAAVGLLRRRR